VTSTALRTGLAANFCYIAIARLTSLLRDRSAAPTLINELRV
jgi:hypothetical protein